MLGNCSDLLVDGATLFGDGVILFLFLFRKSSMVLPCLAIILSCFSFFFRRSLMVLSCVSFFSRRSLITPPCIRLLFCKLSTLVLISFMASINEASWPFILAIICFELCARRSSQRRFSAQSLVENIRYKKVILYSLPKIVQRTFFETILNVLYAIVVRSIGVGKSYTSLIRLARSFSRRP